MKYPCVSLYLNILYSADAVAPTPWKLYVPKNEPVNKGENIVELPVITFALNLPSTYESPQTNEDVLTTNPLSGEIDAVTLPLFNINVSNDKLAMLIFVNPLPSP